MTISIPAIEPATSGRPVMNQLMAKVSSVPNVRQLMALSTDLECVSAPRKKVTRNAPCSAPVKTYHAQTALPVPAPVINPRMNRQADCMHFGLEKLPKPVDLTDQSQRFAARGRWLAPLEGRKMKLPAAIVVLCALSGTAFAETQDCKTLTDPAARLTCYDRINPPIASYPIPLPKPAHHIPLTRPDGTPGSADPDGSADGGGDAEVNAKMNSICRGC